MSAFFTAFNLRYSEIMQLSHNAEQITVVAEDDHGNIVKKKIAMTELGEKMVQSKDLKTEEKTKSQEKVKSSIVRTTAVRDTKEILEGEHVEEIIKKKDINSETMVDENSFDYTEGNKESDGKKIELTTMGNKQSKSGDNESGRSISDANKIQETSIVQTWEGTELGKSIGYAHSTTTSNITEIREKLTLPNGDAIQSKRNAVNEFGELASDTNSGKADDVKTNDVLTQVSAQSIAAESQDRNHNSKIPVKNRQGCDDNMRNSAVMEDAKIEYKGQHSSQETADDIQGNSSDSASRDSMYAVKKRNSGEYLQTETEYSNAAEDLMSLDLSTLRKVESRPVQSSASITRLENGMNSTLSEKASEFMLNHVDDVNSAAEGPIVSEISETDEDVMKNSAKSHDSEESVDAVQQKRVVDVVEVDIQVDNFTRNEQHNMAVQQTVESNQREGDGKEMIQSFHMENGNSNF